MTAAEVRRLSLRAGFVFSGRVDRTGATTMELVQPTKQTAIVHVDEVLRAPGDFGERRGSDVTVRLGSPARKGERAVFFTVGWISGTGLAVQEIGRQSTEDLDMLRKWMEDAMRQEEAAVLRTRFAEAQVVVVGKVAETGPVGGREQPPASEHDPQWRTAFVVVERVEKGDAKPGQRLEIAFASSRDVMWFRAPKPAPGERAVFLLRRRKLEELDVTAFAIVEPPDMRSEEEFERLLGVMNR